VTQASSDSCLPEAADDTDESATIEHIVEQHYAFVWRLLRRLGLGEADAEDAAQQVFMIASQKVERIAPECARSYLYGVALRVANNARRGLRRRREVVGEQPEHAAPPERGPDQMAELAKMRALLDSLLGKLPEDLQRVLVLAEIEQFEVAEIARAERIPVGTAASRLRRARARFREELANVMATDGRWRTE
jgi:RNA polymerase sigma-70 factor (ECF subfamily)